MVDIDLENFRSPHATGRALARRLRISAPAAHPRNLLQADAEMASHHPRGHGTWGLSLLLLNSLDELDKSRKPGSRFLPVGEQYPYVRGARGRDRVMASLSRFPYAAES